ncbi:hypothetical protein JCM10212_003337 [Sporobolomyces blumeae]
MLRLSTLLPLALATTTSFVAATPIQRDFVPTTIIGQTPSVLHPDGTLDTEALERDVQRSLERSLHGLKGVDGVGSTGSFAKVKRQSNTAALTDFQELAYLADVSVGTPAQHIPLLLDTGSADLVIPASGSECTVLPCFDTASSSSFVNLNESVTFAYGQGNIDGKIVSDTVTLGGVTVENQSFGLVSSADSAALQKSANGGIPLGIFGLSFDSIKKLPGATFFDNVIASSKLSQNLFGLYLAPRGQSGSEVSLGAANPDKYTGRISTFNVKSKSHWTVQTNTLVVDGRGIWSGHVYTVIDSGTTSSVMPKALTDAFFAKIPGAQPAFTLPRSVNGQDIVAQVYAYPCASTVEPAFAFEHTRHRALQIAAEDLILAPADAEGTMCYSSLLGADVTYDGQSAALLGINFLRSWYTIHNFDDATISFATAAK